MEPPPHGGGRTVNRGCGASQSQCRNGAAPSRGRTERWGAVAVSPAREPQWSRPLTGADGRHHPTARFPACRAAMEPPPHGGGRNGHKPIAPSDQNRPQWSRPLTGADGLLGRRCRPPRPTEPQWSRPLTGADGRAYRHLEAQADDAAMEPPPHGGGRAPSGTVTVPRCSRRNGAAPSRGRTAEDGVPRPVNHLLAAMEPPPHGGGRPTENSRTFQRRLAAMEPPPHGGGRLRLDHNCTVRSTGPQWSRPLTGADGAPQIRGP